MSNGLWQRMVWEREFYVVCIGWWDYFLQQLLLKYKHLLMMVLEREFYVVHTSWWWDYFPQQLLLQHKHLLMIIVTKMNSQNWKNIYRLYLISQNVILWIVSDGEIFMYSSEWHLRFIDLNIFVFCLDC